jgi:hypothetical protein
MHCASSATSSWQEKKTSINLESDRWWKGPKRGGPASAKKAEQGNWSRAKSLGEKTNRSGKACYECKLSWAYHISSVSSNWQDRHVVLHELYALQLWFPHLSQIVLWAEAHPLYAYQRHECMIYTPKLNNSSLIGLVSLNLMFVFDRTNTLYLHYTERQFFQPLSKACIHLCFQFTLCYFSKSQVKT